MGGTTALALTGASLFKSKKEADQRNAQAAADHQTRIAAIQRQQSQDAQARQDMLEKISAQHSARFSAQGIDPGDGSSGAVLKGLQDKTSQQLEEQANKYDTLRARAHQTFSEILMSNLNKKRLGTDLLLKDEQSVQQIKDWS